MSDAGGGTGTRGARVAVVFDAPEEGMRARSMALAVSNMAELLAIAVEIGSLGEDLIARLAAEAEERQARQTAGTPRMKVTNEGDVPREKQRYPEKPPRRRPPGLEQRELQRAYRRHHKAFGVRPLRDEDVLVMRASYASPFEVVFLIAGGMVVSGGGLWALVQAIERVINIPVNRQILKIERDLKELDLAQRREEYERRLHLTGLQQREIAAVSTIKNIEVEPVRVRILEEPQDAEA